MIATLIVVLSMLWRWRHVRMYVKFQLRATQFWIITGSSPNTSSLQNRQSTLLIDSSHDVIAADHYIIIMSANKILSKHRLVGSLLRRHISSTKTSSSCIIYKRITATGQQSHHAHYFSTTTKGGSETAPFDRSVKLKQRTRAAESCRQHYHYNNTNDVSSSRPILPYDYFHREI